MSLDPYRPPSAPPAPDEPPPFVGRGQRPFPGWVLVVALAGGGCLVAWVLVWALFAR